MEKHKKHNMRETSLQNFRNPEFQKKLGTRQLEVYKAISRLCDIQKDCTDYEVAKFLNKQDPNYVRPRRYELVNKYKMVGYKRKRKCNVTGKIALAWGVLKR